MKSADIVAFREACARLSGRPATLARMAAARTPAASRPQRPPGVAAGTARAGRAALPGVRRFTALLLLALPATAQTLYRCGNTYSQTPCSDQAQRLRVYAASAPQAVAGPRGFALCAAKLPAELSARAQPLGKRRTEVIPYAGQPMQALRFDLQVLPEGGHPAQRYACWLSEDQARLLQFEPLPAAPTR